MNDENFTPVDGVLITCAFIAFMTLFLTKG